MTFQHLSLVRASFSHTEGLVICTPYPMFYGHKIEKNEIGETCGVWGGGVYRVLVRKPEGKRPLGRPRRTWENNIKMDL